MMDVSEIWMKTGNKNHPFGDLHSIESFKTCEISKESEKKAIIIKISLSISCCKQHFGARRFMCQKKN